MNYYQQIQILSNISAFLFISDIFWLVFVWFLPVNPSGMVVPTRTEFFRIRSSTGIAFMVIGTHKLLRHVKAPVFKE